MNRKSKKKKVKTRKSYSKYYGISQNDLSYIKLDQKQNSVRSGGLNTNQNIFRKQINNRVIDTAKPEDGESVILAKMLVYLEKLHKNPNSPYNDKDIVERHNKEMTEEDYYDMKDDIYYSETTNDYDELSNPDNMYFDDIRNQILNYEPTKIHYCDESNHCEDISTLHNTIIIESNKNRGLLSSDKPRGELVRKTEDAKRASCPEGIGKCAGNAILSLAQKVL